VVYVGSGSFSPVLPTGRKATNVDGSPDSDRKFAALLPVATCQKATFSPWEADRALSSEVR
jgi:hypothetical protein